VDAIVNQTENIWHPMCRYSFWFI